MLRKVKDSRVYLLAHLQAPWQIKCCAANANGFCVYLQPQGAHIQANYLILIEMPQGGNMEST